PRLRQAFHLLADLPELLTGALALVGATWIDVAGLRPSQAAELAALPAGPGGSAPFGRRRLVRAGRAAGSEQRQHEREGAATRASPAHRQLERRQHRRPAPTPLMQRGVQDFTLGSETWKVAPAPTAALTWMRPPCRATMRLTDAS